MISHHAIPGCGLAGVSGAAEGRLIAMASRRAVFTSTTPVGPSWLPVRLYGPGNLPCGGAVRTGAEETAGVFPGSSWGRCGGDSAGHRRTASPSEMSESYPAEPPVFDVGGFADLARKPVPPKLINIARRWIRAPPETVNK